LVEYHKRKLEKEAKEKRVARVHEAPYDRIREVLEELEATCMPTRNKKNSEKFSRQ
jgi:hypothetical protein